MKRINVDLEAHIPNNLSERYFFMIYKLRVNVESYARIQCLQSLHYFSESTSLEAHQSSSGSYSGDGGGSRI